MKTLKQLVPLILILNFASCGTTRLPKGTTAINQKTSAGYIPNRIIEDIKKGDLISSYGTVFFDATKRSAVTTIYKEPLKTKFLAEEQPDAAITYVEKIVSDISTNIKKGKVDSTTINATAKFTKELTTSLTALTEKSNSLNFLRTALYRLNEAHYNEQVDTTYIKQFSEAIRYAKEIQLAEINLDSLNVSYQLKKLSKE
ncbi:hypothetical protein [Cellulophaga sp. Ld12]|uniref:hypothetical protein n=1 Tax=Cellulophaga sp. Ld12 TaxID=3229535 RepID=UPI00386FAA18